MKIKNIILFSIIFVITFNLGINANTNRDIGDEPDLDRNLIAKWILFYTNIERLKNNQSPLVYDPDLEKAAQWQAEYSSKIRNLDHVAIVKDMKTPKDRIEHFNAVCGNCGENLTVNFSINSEQVPFYIKTDEKGSYHDFGNYTVYWRNERQMAYAMLESWMKSPGHRKNILNNGFLWMGAGAFKGIYSNNKSYYACQVFNGYGGLQHDLIKSKYELPRVTLQKSFNDEKESYIISNVGQYEPGVIDVNKDKELVTYPVTNKGSDYFFIKQKATLGILFIALYDKKTNIIYPVIMLK